MAALFLAFGFDLGALPPDRTVSQYVRRAWTVEQGLPHGTVRGVTQTRDGYLWLATYEGLVRFNGEDFRILDKASNPDMFSNSIATMCRTRDDALWLGTLTGLMRYHDGRFQTVETRLGTDIINALAASGDGAVWAGTAGGRLLRIAGVKPELLALPLPKSPITALAPVGDALWIGTSLGLARYQGGRLELWSEAMGLSSDRIITLLADEGGALLVGTGSGLDRIENGRIEHIRGLPADQVTALHRDRDGNLWIGTYSNGLFRMSDRRISSYGIGDGLLNPTVRAIFEDDEGSLWIGSNGGLEQFRVGAFVTWNEREGLTDEYARAVFEDREGTLWVGSANGLSRWENGRWTRVADSRFTGILSIAQSRDGSHWFGTANGVYRVAPGGRVTLLTTADGLSHNAIRDIHEDRRGDVWLATDFGLDRLRPDGAIESFSGRGGLGANYAMAIAETSDGRIWVVTGGGLGEFDGTTFKLHSAPRELPSNHNHALDADDDGTVWLTGGDGLVRYRDGSFRTITTREGLASDKILSLVDDGDGNLWLGTVRGAFVVSKRELNAVADRTSTRLVWRLFDENDGLGSRQCNGHGSPTALRSRDGRIWFVTANGVSALTKSRAPAPPARSPVVERVSIDGKPVEPASLRSVAPGAGRIEFEFAGLTFATPERLKFRYRVVGYDHDWIDAGAKRVASYTNLPAGSYRFILASSRDGLTWHSTALPFELQPQFWETKWFIALCVAAVAALLLVLHSMRLRLSRERARVLEKLVDERTRQISEEKERTEVALAAAEASARDAEAARGEAERHEQLTERALAHAEEANRAKSIFLAATSHELRTPLNAIIGFSEILISEPGEQSDSRQRRFLDNIHSSGQYLLGIINNILDLSKVEAGKMEMLPETIVLRDVVTGIGAVMKGVSTLRKITIEFEISDDVPLIEADQTLLKQILYNLMSNAVKFSPIGSSVVVSVQPLPGAISPIGENAVEIRVRDRGIGIDPKDHQLIFQEFRQAHGSRGERPQGTGLGLALVKRFVEMHRGTIHVESEPGQGSTFVVVLPCRFKSAGSSASLHEDAVERR